MRVLLVKMSSLGDVFHTLPAITDAQKAVSDLTIDWVVEKAFAEIPTWHSAVRNVIEINWRDWRKSFWLKTTRKEIHAFWQRLRLEEYDLIVDAQGLIKSAVVTSLAKGVRYGLDQKSAKESLASLAYQKKITVTKGRHAIVRLRDFFAQCLEYPMPDTPVDYGIDKRQWKRPDTKKPYVIFLHGSTWETKLWPEQYWKRLRDIATHAGYEVLLTWGNLSEKQRAEFIASGSEDTHVLERLPLTEITRYLAHADAVVAVDTGLAHIVSALNVPTVAVYGATNPDLTGVFGQKASVLKSQFECTPCLMKKCRFSKQQSPLHPPCYEEITPEDVWLQLQK